MLLVLANVPLMIDTPLAPDPPVRLPLIDGADHVYVVPAGKIPLVILVGVTVNVTPLQVIVLIAVIAGVGLMVTVTVNAAPIPQLGTLGKTV